MTYIEERIFEVTVWCIDQIDNYGVTKEEITKSIMINIEDANYDKDFKQVLNGVLNKLKRLGYVAVN